MNEPEIPICPKCGAETFTYPSGEYCPRCDVEQIIELAKAMVNNLRLISE
jgi:uncharacterized OB-fold protein